MGESFPVSMLLACRSHRHVHKLNINNTTMMNTHTTAATVLSNASIRFRGVPSSARMLQQIEAFVQRVMETSKIDGLQLLFAHDENRSPAYRASLQLAVPGPDLHCEHDGATLAQAWQKVTADVQKRLRDRDAKRIAARKRSEPRRGLASAH